MYYELIFTRRMQTGVSSFSIQLYADDFAMIMPVVEEALSNAGMKIPVIKITDAWDIVHYIQMGGFEQVMARELRAEEASKLSAALTKHHATVSDDGKVVDISRRLND